MTTIPKDAILDRDLELKNEHSRFFPVQVKEAEGGAYKATPVIGESSIDISSIRLSDGFIELPENKDKFSRGETYSFYSWE